LIRQKSRVKVEGFAVAEATPDRGGLPVTFADGGGRFPALPSGKSPGTSTPFRVSQFLVAEKCGSIFLGLQGENLAEGRGGEEPPHLPSRKRHQLRQAFTWRAG